MIKQRVIKFRAWNNHHKVMIPIYDSSTRVTWFLPNVGDKFEIMQYTNIQDVNGVDLYEGDLCMLTNEHGIRTLAQIEYNDGCFEVVFIRPLLGMDVPLFSAKRDYLKSYIGGNRAIEVLGNRYENPELCDRYSKTREATK